MNMIVTPCRLSCVAALVSAGVLCACTGRPAPAPEGVANLPPPARKISAQEAIALMREVGDFVLLDVRTEAEYRQGHLPQAHLIPEAEVASRARAELPNKDTPVFVYCRSGVRSASAARTLAALGYTQVFDAGGILSWPRE